MTSHFCAFKDDRDPLKLEILWNMSGIHPEHVLRPQKSQSCRIPKQLRLVRRPAITRSHLEQVGQACAQLGVDFPMDGVSTISWDKLSQSSTGATLKGHFPGFRWNSIRAVPVLALPGLIPGLCCTGSLELGPALQGLTSCGTCRSWSQQLYR